MQYVAPPLDVSRSIKTAPVIGEVVDVQLREAAWASMARLRLAADPKATLAALRRWEHYLSGNMAGLASVMNTRLSIRLHALMSSPQELASESFVAALLLLRCDRARHEAQVFAAWRSVDEPEVRDRIAQAIIHGGLRDAKLQQALAEHLVGNDSALRASATDIIAAWGRPIDGATARTLKTQAHDGPLATTRILELMATGALPLDARPIAQALQHSEPDLSHAADKVLFSFAPKVLAHHARQQLAAGEDVSLLGLEALAGQLLVGGPQQSLDLRLLVVAAARGRMGPLVAHALGLSGLTSGASVLLHLIGHTQSSSMQQAAAESFFTLTGIEARPNALIQEGTPAAVLQQELRAAWSPQASPCDPSPTRHMLLGRPADAALLLQGLAHMQVGRWQSLRRMLLSRSLGALRLSPWALMQQQVTELHGAQAMLTQALTTTAPGLSSNSLTWALMRLRPSA